MLDVVAVRWMGFEATVSEALFEDEVVQAGEMSHTLLSSYFLNRGMSNWGR